MRTKAEKSGWIGERMKKFLMAVLTFVIIAYTIIVEVVLLLRRLSEVPGLIKTEEIVRGSSDVPV